MLRGGVREPLAELIRLLLGRLGSSFLLPHGLGGLLLSGGQLLPRLREQLLCIGQLLLRIFQLCLWEPGMKNMFGTGAALKLVVDAVMQQHGFNVRQLP